MNATNSLGMTLVTGVLMLAATAAHAEHRYFNPYAPDIQMNVEGGSLTLDFPESTLRETVTFKAVGVDFNKGLMRAHRDAFVWIDEDTMRVDLDRIFGRGSRIGGDIENSTSWVWGQLRSGTALLQPVRTQ